MSKKRALITGITGMVGSHLCDYLLKNTDWEIYGMSRWRSPFDNIKHLIPRIEKKDRCNLLYGDLNDYISLQNVLEIAKPDYLFHLAAQSYPKTSFDSPIDTFNTNILGTSKLLEANAMLFSNVSVRSYGLSSKEGIIQTSYSDENVGGASVTSQASHKNKVEFHLKKLDDQLSVEQRSSVSLIKLDVEGHEYEVLCGAVMILKESSPLILFEINVGEIEHGSTKAKEFLNANGYTYFYHLKDISPFANTAVRLSKLINALSVLFFGKKLRGKLIPHRVTGKLKNKNYSLILASKDELPFD